MEPSPQQAAFIKEMKQGTSRNIVLDSRAGTGKTTTMIMGVNQTDPADRVICTAFNKSIAVTLGERMPEHCLCKTFHALGLAAWSANTGKRPQVEGKKTWKIANQMGLKFDQFTDLARLIGLAKNIGIRPGDQLAEKGGLTPDTMDVWQDLFEDFALDPGEIEHPVDFAREVLAKSGDQSWQGIIDFDDMVYMPAVFGGPLPIGEMVVVDEAQDTNAVQMKMISTMAAGGRLIAVGDPYQAIYAFRGADSTAMNRIIDKFEARVMPLSVSYRCPRAVVAEAQKYVDGFESHPSAIQGSVSELQQWSHTRFSPNDVILCRNNKPLLSLAFSLIREGMGCYVKGREIGQGLVKLINRMKAEDMNQLYTRLEDFLIAEKNKLAARGKDAQADNLDDRVQSVLCLMDKLPEDTTIDELIRTIDKLFDEKRGLLTLSTIHKAKGLEWPNVYFLDPWLLPSKFARTPGQRQQEDNLSYVGITRAQENLFYIDSKGKQ